MKQAIITIIFLFLLTSCFSSNNEIGIEGVNNDKEKINVKTSNETTSEEAIINIESQENVDTKNTEEENQEEQITNNKSLIMKNYNVFLRESGKEDIALTTKSKGKECDWNIQEEQIVYKYQIISDKGKFGVVRRSKYICGMDADTITYFIINLNNQANKDTEMVELKSYNENSFVEHKIKVIGDFMLIQIKNSNYNVVEKLEDIGRNYLKQDLVKDGYKLIGNFWEKKINLEKITPTKKLSNKILKKNNEINNGKYIHENLIKDGYKLNKLGNINEYYRDRIIPEETTWENGEEITLHQGGSRKDTIYIKGNKILDFSIIIQAGNFLQVNYPREDFGIDLYPYGYDFIQPIFGNDNGKNIVIQDMDTIKVINKEQGINKVIWKRGKGFIE